MIKFQQGLDPDPELTHTANLIVTIQTQTQTRTRHTYPYNYSEYFLITIMAMDGVTFEFDSRSTIQLLSHIHPVIIDVKSCLILGPYPLIHIVCNPGLRDFYSGSLGT